MNYQPVRNLVLIRAQKSSDKSEGGLFLPSSAVQTLNEGEVVNVGPDVSGDIAVKDVVVFAKHSDWKIDIDGTTYIAVEESSILLKKTLA
jgi:chaperonin GroES